MNTKEQLLQKIENRTARVAVMGLGYVGLPLAVVFADVGFEVTGIDPDQSKIDCLKRGESYIQDVPSEDVRRHVEAGRLRATSDFAALGEMDSVSICVPTPLRKTGDPDLSFILDASRELCRHLHPGMLIVLESTTYPGTTRELMLPTISEGTDLEIGVDFFLAFSPERVDPGRTDFTTINTPKVMGGVTQACGEVAAAMYGQALQEIVRVSSSEAAEMTKLLENTFRMVNIGLVNEMALMCERLGIDVWEVIEAAATKPFGYMKFTPGPGLGGHCIPIDPLYLSWKLRSLNYTARFIELASEINTGMPRHVVSMVMDALNDRAIALKGSQILVLGVAFKPNVDDVRESPALDVIGLLQEKGAHVRYHDPYVPRIRQDEIVMDSEADAVLAARQADCVVIITNHDMYDYAAILDAARLIVDTRNATGNSGAGRQNVIKL